MFLARLVAKLVMEVSVPEHKCYKSVFSGIMNVKRDYMIYIQASGSKSPAVHRWTHTNRKVYRYILYAFLNTMNHAVFKKRKKQNPSLFQKCSASHQQAETYEQSFWEKM